MSLKTYASTASFRIPPGVIEMYGGASAPTGWLMCLGTAVSRSTYSALFAVIGTTFGAGDGSTTFNLPNFQSKFPGGVEAVTDMDLGETGGDNNDDISHNHGATGLSMSSESSHTHGVTVPGETVGESPTGLPHVVGKDGAVTSSAGFPHNHSISGNTSAGGDTTHENRPAYLAVNFIIKH